MPTLAALLLNEESRPVVVADCAVVIDEEVASKRGISGLAIKAAFKTVKTFKKGIIPGVVNALLDDFVAEMQPFYGVFLEEDVVHDVTVFVVRDGADIAESLLGITDRRAERSKYRVLVKAYKRLRPQGKKQVVAAMPRIGALLAKHGA